jgi:hypothetical protein
VGQFKATVEVVGTQYHLTRTCVDGSHLLSVVDGFDNLIHELRMWLPIYPCFGAEPSTPAQPPSTLAPEPINNTPADVPLSTPSRFQIGAPVAVAGTVVGVLFREGEVNYEVALGTTDALGEPDVTLVRAYDVGARVMAHVGGEWR